MWYRALLSGADGGSLIFCCKVDTMFGRQSTTWLREASGHVTPGPGTPKSNTRLPFQNNSSPTCFPPHALPGETCGFPFPIREAAYCGLITLSLLLTMIDFIPDRAPSAVVNLDPRSAFSTLPGRMGLLYTSSSSSSSASSPRPADVALLSRLQALADAPGSSVPVPVDGGGMAPCPLAALLNIDTPAVCSAAYQPASDSNPPVGSITGTPAAPYGFVAVLEFGPTNTSLQAPRPWHPVDTAAFDVHYVLRPNRSTLASVQGVVSLVDGALLDADAGAGGGGGGGGGGRPTIAS
eukprot:728139-Rhodomonas_salina.2